MEALKSVKDYCEQKVAHNISINDKKFRLEWRSGKIADLKVDYIIYLRYYKKGKIQYANKYRICISFTTKNGYDGSDRDKIKDYIKENQDILKKYINADLFYGNLLQENDANKWPITLYKPEPDPLEEWAYTNFLGCDKIIEIINKYFKKNKVQKNSNKNVVTDVEYNDYSEGKIIPKIVKALENTDGNLIETEKIEQYKFGIKKVNETDFIELAKKCKENNVKERITTVKQYSRSIIVSEFARRMAKGICQLCGENAPFLNKEGEPFLEVHHIKELANGGSDSLDNVIALCPNCHRKIHILHDEEDIEFLTDLAQTYYEKLC